MSSSGQKFYKSICKVITSFLSRNLHRLHRVRGRRLPLTKEVLMDSLLIIAGSGVLSSLWILAGTCLAYEVWNMFE